MTSPSKAKGDRAEVALVNYLRPWFPHIRRMKAGAEKDLGDIAGIRDRDGDDWTVQVADRKSLVNHGAVLAKAREAAEQSERAGTPLWMMVVKRPGCADVGQWFVWLPGWATKWMYFTGLRTTGAVIPKGQYIDGDWPDTDNDLVQLTVRAWVALVAPERTEDVLWPTAEAAPVAPRAVSG